MKISFYLCMIKRIVVGFILILFLWHPVFAASVQISSGEQEGDITTVEESPDVNLDDFGHLLFKTVLSLILVVVLVYVGTFVFKRFVHRPRREGGAFVRIIGSTMLGPKKSIYLVEVEDRVLVLGVTDASISFLTELENQPADGTQDLTRPKESGISKRGFRQVLDSLLKKRGDDG